MVNQASEDIIRVHINLYASDVEYLKLKLGYGFTTQLRELVREYTLSLKAELEPKS